MKKKQRITDGKILAALKEANGSANIDELCNRLGISSAVLAKWVSKYGVLPDAEARRLKHLEDENRRLRSLVADLTLSNQALKLAFSKKW